MRINIYAEEMTDQVEIVQKEVEGTVYTGLRLYLHLPVTLPSGEQAKGPFIHKPGDDDSSAVTFWGKRDLRKVVILMWQKLEEHYSKNKQRPTIAELEAILNNPEEPGIEIMPNGEIRAKE